MDKYDPIKLVHDANAFTESEFGQHYLDRLRKAKERQLAVVEDDRYTDSQRAHAGSKMAAIQSELDYFATANTVRENPALMNRLVKKLTGKEEPDPIV